MSAPSACPACLARAWLLVRLAGHLDLAGDRVAELLTLDDGELVEAVGGRHRAELERELAGFDAAAARAGAEKAGLEVVCRCDPAYPGRLAELDAPPAVLHVAGGLERLVSLLDRQPVAIVGARGRRPTGSTWRGRWHAVSVPRVSPWSAGWRWASTARPTAAR